MASGRQSGTGRLAYQELRLAEAASESLVFQRGETRNDQGFHTAVGRRCSHGLPRWSEGEDRVFLHLVRDRQAEPNSLRLSWPSRGRPSTMQDSTVRNSWFARSSRRPHAAAHAGPRLRTLDRRARRRVEPPTLNVRLHFAELERAQTGQRVFDVKLQGQTVLAGFDIAQAAGGTNRAVTREFANVTAARALIVELVPGSASSALEPTLCPSNSPMPYRRSRGPALR